MNYLSQATKGHCGPGRKTVPLVDEPSLEEYSLPSPSTGQLLLRVTPHLLQSDVEAFLEEWPLCVGILKRRIRAES